MDDFIDSEWMNIQLICTVAIYTQNWERKAK